MLKYARWMWLALALATACQRGDDGSEPAPPAVEQETELATEPAGEPTIALPPPPPPEQRWWEPADQACPESARLRGAAPPHGTELRCELPDGRLHGRVTRWGKLGNKLADGAYREGQKHGLFTAYHASGEKSLQVEFVQGREHGPVTTWHANGQKMLEGAYRRGEGHGPWTRWDDQGNVVGTGTYGEK